MLCKEGIHQEINTQRFKQHSLIPFSYVSTNTIKTALSHIFSLWPSHPREHTTKNHGVHPPISPQKITHSWVCSFNARPLVNNPPKLNQRTHAQKKISLPLSDLRHVVPFVDPFDPPLTITVSPSRTEPTITPDNCKNTVFPRVARNRRRVQRVEEEVEEQMVG